MGRSRGATAIAVCAAALAAAPAALASSGSDQDFRGEHWWYDADPGEANQLTVENTDTGLHLNDPGAIIRWVSVPTIGHCEGGVHDVFCVGIVGGFEAAVDLGDGNDSFVNRADGAAAVTLGPGDDSAVGGGHGYDIDGGPGADDIHGGPKDPDFGGHVGEKVSYETRAAAVNVSGDDVANDGNAGEHDNIHPDVRELDGTPFNDRISGFSREIGGAGSDVLTGSGGDDEIYDSTGNDVLIGGAGRDTLEDTAGNNSFYARDGEADRVVCGTGYDIVFADPQDDLTPPADFGGPCDEVHVG